ncbi:hypothetical protein TCAL_00814 [Tigriopus californicus]|uniref:Uncharacterized protein n=2 Tax=Tigriopus californicus TaxID=6832 RepID=A0A553NBE7_TIGCA|nr:hypothetical protein TCAL_00814 [Tigriopus californicus]|eukprot:TCALIF_00814-PA protein Name:"Similar to EAPP E2F-associated phosphoprotein (Homo sapiens)" AED:0.39 eAED:0.40 QI:0/-1/0/1/-1/1/1/0/158
MPLTQPVASRGLRSQRKANRQPGGPNPFEVVDDVVDPEDSLMADPFELEMENELEQRAQHAQKAQGWTEPLKGEDLDPGPSSSSASGTYDPIYFDSDDEDHDKDKETESENQPESSLATPSKRKMMSNDELLYDPDQDDRDQAWADSVRKQYLPDQHR